VKSFGILPSSEKNLCQWYRITTLVHILGIVILESGFSSSCLLYNCLICCARFLPAIPLSDCDYLRKESFLYPFTTPVTLLLFVMRTSALYNNNRYMVAFLVLSWLCVLICSALVPLGVMGIPFANTNYCIEIKTPVSWALTRIPPFTHDTIVFAVTSFALMRSSYSDDNKGKLRTMVLGKYLPAFSKSLLRDGQAYYL